MDGSFESTDSVRTAGPLTHVLYAEFPTQIRLERGGMLPGMTVAYETYGDLNPAADNAVLVCHAITGDSHVAAHDRNDDQGWWDELVGPGKGIDTDRLFVICANVLGGCRGSTGPGTTDPSTGKPYGGDFPLVTVHDMVDAQKRLIDVLGIKKLRAVVGGSFGGHQVLSWATRYPDFVATSVVIASSARLSSQALAFDVIGRNAIQTDPHFAGGQYYSTDQHPHTGLALARMLGHITYLSSDSMTRKFDPNRNEPRQLATEFEKRFSVGSYLAYQGTQFVRRFDANSYIAITLAMDLVDFGATHDRLKETLRHATCDWLVVSFSSDWLFPPSLSRALVAAMTSLGHSVSYCELQSDSGHDGFLLPSDVRAYSPLIAARLGAPAPRPSSINPIDNRGSAGVRSTPEGVRSAIDERILQLIPAGASVLDLGCGRGDLLARLRARGSSRLCGADVSTDNIVATVQHGVDAIDCDLNLGLPDFEDAQFDYVVISSTLQAVPNVEQLLSDALRVGRRVILSFSNFAYEPLREMFANQGRVPRSPGPYDFEWFNTPNRRFPSILDVLDLCERMKLTIEDEHYYDMRKGTQISRDEDPNLKADTAILVLRR